MIPSTMKWKQGEPPRSMARVALTSSLFLFVCFLCFFTSLTQINLQQVIKLSTTPIFSPRAFACSTTTVTATTPPAFRLLIGILTLPDQYRHRNLLRLVYSTQTPAAAEIDVKFVFCSLSKDDQRVLIALEILRFDDIIILNCTENMNDGKTYAFFSALPDLFPSRYDYVMKADDDIYIRLGPLTAALTPLPRDDLYYGFTIPCREMNPFNHYMSGMGYVLSWDIVEWIATSEIARNHTAGPEDKVVGEWLQMGGKGKKRYNAKPAMYDYPTNVMKNMCERDLSPETIAVHRLKNQDKWIKTLLYFNATERLKSSRFYHIPYIRS